VVSKRTIEKDVTSIARMGKQELMQRIQGFHGRFRLDFSDDYLRTASVDRLRHILFAATLNCRQ